ncbi:MAG: hypothetical protein U0936_16800 [Planctomycetaceae bacterium]
MRHVLGYRRLPEHSLQEEITELAEIVVCRAGFPGSDWFGTMAFRNGKMVKPLSLDRSPDFGQIFGGVEMGFGLMSN